MEVSYAEGGDLTTGVLTVLALARYALGYHTTHPLRVLLTTLAGLFELSEVRGELKPCSMRGSLGNFLRLSNLDLLGDARCIGQHLELGLEYAIAFSFHP